MTIDILYVADCPHVVPAVEMVHRVLAAEGLACDIQMILVRDQDEAHVFQFSGSPTIRVGGQDVEPVDSSLLPSLSCRLYSSPESSGLPAEESVRRALRRAVGKSAVR